MSLAIFLAVTFALPLCLMRRSAYCSNVSLGWDMLASTWAGGKPGETLSGRAGSAQKQGKLHGQIFAPCINFLARDPGHCARALIGDQLRAQAIIVDQTQ